MQDLKVTTVQTALHWEQVDQNLASFDDLLAQIGEPTDVIVLPEMFSTGFSMRAAELAEPVNGKAFQWMQQKAAAINAVITGSIITKENDQYFNRLIWMQPDGQYQVYNKRHLFRLANEQHTYTGGTHRLIVSWKGWNICPQICYDLRFPVWSRNQNDYDLLLYVANWPERRNHAWKTLLLARAIENLSYVVGVNRIGNDGNDIHHSGDSSVVDFSGGLLYQQSNETAVHTVTLSYPALQDFRNRFRFHQDADAFQIDTDGTE